jgi:UPF0176 protein
LCKTDFQGCCSKTCADVLLLTDEEQKELRKGKDKGQMVFNKSKQRLRATIIAKK